MDWGYFIQRKSPDGMMDFKGVYYGARSVLRHGDPYKVGEPLRVCRLEGGECTHLSVSLNQILSLHVYFPTVFIFTAPFAMLPWGTAHLVWMAASAGILCLAAFLIWDLARNNSPFVALALVCFILANCEAVFATGNPAGIAVGLCVVAVWSFLNEQHVRIGILFLALSLVIKPHDGGLVWLCLLMMGKTYQKRALQTLILTLVLGLPGILWVSHTAPHWIEELHSNLLTDSAPGGAVDPGPSTPNSGGGPSVIINLQSFIALIWNDPHIYNPATYLVCGALLLAGIILILRSRSSKTSAWIPLAFIVPLSMLVTYHRSYDAKLMLLAIPVCAMLLDERSLTGWLAFLVTTAAIVSTSDIPLTVLLILNDNLNAPSESLFGRILFAARQRPTPLILLAMAIFYLWVYLRRIKSNRRVIKSDSLRSAVS